MTDEELITTLRGRNGFGWTEDAADRIEQLTAKLKVLEKTELYLKTMYPEKSGHYFICGESPIKDENGLPERLHICPAYGADWMMLYTRTDKTHGPEY
jgi:hypothetical protein